jgi:putative copper resistance protein D
MYLWLVTLHVFAAMVWIGGTVFLVLVGAPALRDVEPEALRDRLFEAIGLRFRYVGWIAVGILVLTGAGLLRVKGWLSWQVMGSRDFWSLPLGHTLAWKLGAVAVMVVLSAAHDLALSPGRVQEAKASPDWPRRRRRLVLLARAGAIAAVVVVVFAVRLARGV